MTANAVGARIRAAREAQGMTQQDLANHADTTVTLISAVETGRRDPRIDSLRRIAKALGMPVSALLDLDDDTPASTP